jgi:hypothetical protein
MEMEHREIGTEPYVEPIRIADRGRRRLGLSLALAILSAMVSLVAMKAGGGEGASFPRVIHPRSSGVCTSPPNGALYSNAVDGAQMNVCISQQGNINQIQYPDTGTGHTQIAFDGYCLLDTDTNTTYWDYSPGGPSSTGFGPATLSQSASNQWNMTRNTADNKYQLTAFIKINFQPRSIFVGMTVKNIDAANAQHHIAGVRALAPAIDGSPADDQYNEFGGTGAGAGRTGQAFQATPIGANSLLMGPTQAGGSVQPWSNWSGCGGLPEPPGPLSGGNRVLVGSLNQIFPLGPGQSVSLGKFVYRMV